MASQRRPRIARSQCGFCMRILCMSRIWKRLLHSGKVNPLVVCLVNLCSSNDTGQRRQRVDAGVMVTTSAGNDIMLLTDVQYVFTKCTFIVGVLV